MKTIFENLETQLVTTVTRQFAAKGLSVGSTIYAIQTGCWACGSAGPACNIREAGCPKKDYRFPREEKIEDCAFTISQDGLDNWHATTNYGTELEKDTCGIKWFCLVDDAIDHIVKG